MTSKALFRLIFLFFVIASPAIQAQESSNPESRKILAGYYPDWGVWNSPSYTVDMIPYSKLTHVIWSFISPDENGNLRGDAASDPSDLDQMVERAHAAGIKAILSIGGGGLCEHFASVSKSDSLRKRFVLALQAFVEEHNLDGIDMDWEFSKVPVENEDTAAYNVLLRDIRNALPQGKTLSAALPCSDYYGKYFTAEVLLENLDWFGIMTYDITGDWDDKARFDSPLFPSGSKTTWSWKQAAAYWSKRGVPADKLVFGVPSFGFVFTGATGPGTSFDQGFTEYVGYAKLMEMADWQFFYDDAAKEPYALADGLFATYENAQSSIDKGKWITEQNYAGAMIWELSLDYSEAGQPIVETLSAVLLDGIIPEGIRRQAPRKTKGIASRYIYDALGQTLGKSPAPGRYYSK